MQPLNQRSTRVGVGVENKFNSEDRTIQILKSSMTRVIMKRELRLDSQEDELL